VFTGTQIAPILLMPRKLVTASMLLSSNVTTVSPCFTPRLSRRFAVRAARCEVWA
jgi:hypothetical protein